MRLMVVLMMALIIALIIGIGMEAADATEIEAFRHYTGYQKSRLEVEFDQATTFTMVTRAENTTDTVASVAVETPKTTGTMTLTGLAYATRYNVVFTFPEAARRDQMRIFQIETMDRYHFMRLAFRKDDNALLFVKALENAAPAKKLAVLDEVERLCREAFIEMRRAERSEEEKLIESLK